MPEKTQSVLIPGSEVEMFWWLGVALEEQGIRSSWADSPEEALAGMTKYGDSLLVFADVRTCARFQGETLRFFERVQIPVVVVSRTFDVSTYTDMLKRGAADFIVPPFMPSEISRVIRKAGYHSKAVA